jgi:hypothetical protein
MNHHASWSWIVVTSMQCAWELCQVLSMRQVPVLGQNSAKVGLPPTLRPKVQTPDSYPATRGEKSLLTHQHLLCCQWHSTFYLSCFIRFIPRQFMCFSTSLIAIRFDGSPAQHNVSLKLKWSTICSICIAKKDQLLPLRYDLASEDYIHRKCPPPLVSYMSTKYESNLC